MKVQQYYINSLFIIVFCVTDPLQKAKDPGDHYRWLRPCPASRPPLQLSRKTSCNRVLQAEWKISFASPYPKSRGGSEERYRYRARATARQPPVGEREGGGRAGAARAASGSATRRCHGRKVGWRHRLTRRAPLPYNNGFRELENLDMEERISMTRIECSF